MTESPTGCNPNTPAGDTPGTQTVLAGVLPSPFVVERATGSADGQLGPDRVGRAGQTLKPQTIVYTLNPKAVWSDGVPITAADFKYAWEEQRGDPVVSSPDVASIAGYRDIASVTGSNGGHTVTVKFKTTFADWQMLFDNLVPAHVMEKVGWNPTCTTVNPAIDLSGGPFEIESVSGQTITLVQNPKWWGTPANARSITVHIASSTEQLAQWMASGFVQVAQPTTVDAGVPDADDGAAGRAERRRHLGHAAAARHGELARRAAVAGPPGGHRPPDQPPGPREPAGELGGAGDRRWRTATSTCRASRTTSPRRPPPRRRRSRPRPRRPRRRRSVPAAA